METPEVSLNDISSFVSGYSLLLPCCPAGSFACSNYRLSSCYPSGSICNCFGSTCCTTGMYSEPRPQAHANSESNGLYRNDQFFGGFHICCFQRYYRGRGYSNLGICHEKHKDFRHFNGSFVGWNYRVDNSIKPFIKPSSSGTATASEDPNSTANPSTSGYALDQKISIGVRIGIGLPALFISAFTVYVMIGQKEGLLRVLVIVYLLSS